MLRKAAAQISLPRLPGKLLCSTNHHQLRSLSFDGGTNPIIPILAIGIKYWNKHGGQCLFDERKKRAVIFPPGYVGIRLREISHWPSRPQFVPILYPCREYINYGSLGSRHCENNPRWTNTIWGPILWVLRNTYERGSPTYHSISYVIITNANKSHCSHQSPASQVNHPHLT